MRALSVVLALSTLVACGPRNVGPVTEPHLTPATNPAGMDHEGMDHEGMDHEGMGAMEHTMSAMNQAPEPDDPELREGKAIFDQICSACHTVGPPPRLAPPMAMISMHLRERFESEKDGVAHIVSFAPSPNPDKSVLPAHAIERFGLMAPQALPKDKLELVGRYIWSLGEATGGMGMGGMGMGPAMGQGRGMQGGDGSGMRMRTRRRGGG